MGLRVKLAASFWIVLVCAIAATSIACLDRALRVMASNLFASSELNVDETFEQIRDALSNSARDPARAIGNARGLKTAIESAHAFGEYVVYVRIVSADGRVILAAPAEPRGQLDPTALEIGVLKEAAASRMPLRLLPRLWKDHLYEVSAPIDLNGRPFGIIRVGLSTGLIAADVHRLAATIGIIAFAAIVLSTLAAGIVGTQMLRPVKELATGMERLTEGRGEVSLPFHGHDELATLAEKFNQLAARVWTERAQWETERGRLVGVFRAITDCVLLIDARGTLLFANPEAQSRLRLAANSEGKPLNILLGANHPLTQLVTPALSLGTEVHDVAIELGDNGADPTRALVSIFSMGQSHAPAGLLIMIRDLERMNELEAVVDYSSRLARLGGLLSGVAHQIRGPLNAMSAQLELLRQEAQNGDPVDNRIERLRFEMTRLDQTVDALMRFMRPQELKTEEVAVNDLVRQVGNTVAQPEIKVDYSLDENAGRIVADKALLFEALRNIVQNGVQAMPQGGVLGIRTSRNGGGYIDIAISDQGPGIASENRDRMFDLYFTTKKGGSGLGLPLALKAIDLHHGSLQIDSEPGSGTTVKIRLPAQQSLPVSATPGLLRA